MPWTVEKSSRCPASKPWGVINQSSGNVDGCHPTKARARQQQKALYASESRRSANGVAFSQTALAAAGRAEETHLSELHTAWQRALELAGAQASKKFALVAAGEWQPPAEGSIITEAQIAALAASLNRELLPIWTRVIIDTANPPLAPIEISWDVKHPVPRRLLDQAARRTGARLGEAVQFILRDTISAAYENGLSVRETSSMIRTAIDAAAPWQADMLARTDLNSLSNGASKSAAEEAGLAFKTWLATADDKTRPEHLEADGQTVPINMPFSVGGEDADYPGDPNLSDSMSCNCRCTLIYGGSLDEVEGLLADAGGIIMPDMATKEQRRRKYERRAAHAKGGVIPPKVVTPETLEEALVAGAVGVHHTGVVSGAWDGPAAMQRCSSAADYRSICAWFETGADLALTGSWKFPHHANPGGPANINGVRNALARLPQAKIPDGDRAGVEAHLRAHLNDFNRRQGNNAALVAAPQAIPFEGVAAIEGKISDDNTLAPRVLMPDSLTWPEMPVSFMAQTVTAEGHDGAEVAGRIDKFARKRAKRSMYDIEFSGELTTPYGVNEIAPMIEDKTMRYVSADLGAAEWSIVDRKSLAVVPDTELNAEALQDGMYALGCMSAKIKAVTLVPAQAIEGAMVALTASADEHGIGIETYEDSDDIRIVVPLEEMTVDGEALVASASEWAPPKDWFDMPELPGKMPLTVTKDGRVYGHLATWDSCHVSFLPSCVPPPKSPSNYAYFHVSELDTEDGDTVTVGKLMFSPTDGGHADRRLTATKASQYYDRTGMVAAFGRVSDGAHGIWFAGSLNPRMTAQQRKDMRCELRLHPPSGDWRPINGEYELICGLAVAVPGFPTPRATVTVTASAEGFELQDAIIASSGVFEADPQALFAAERLGIADEEALAERRMHALAARAEGLDALAALVE